VTCWAAIRGCSRPWGSDSSWQAEWPHGR